MEKISLVVPCYNEEKMLKIFLDEIKKVIRIMSYVSFEVIFVDDGSNDQTLKVIRKFAEECDWIFFISFSRNFGKEAAIYAGIKRATGDYIAIIDADLQDPPELLVQMYKGIKEEGYDVVATRRVDREGEPLIRSFFARMFYKIMNRITNVRLVDGARDYRLMNRKYVNAILEVKEYNRFSKGIFEWVGFSTKWLEYKNVKRIEGETKWSFFSLLKYSIEGVLAFTTAPLTLTLCFGFIISLFSFFSLLFIVVRKIIFNDPVAGWASLICVLIFFGGLQIFFMGILGSYFSKMYMEIKNRPLYIIKEEKKGSSET